jgi:hypothetical protein
MTGDALAHRHRLDLIVGDVDGRDAKPPVQLDEFGPRLNAQFGVQVGQRFVHQKDLRLAHDGPAERDALPLTARKRLGLAIQQVLDVQKRGGVLDAFIYLGLDAPRLGHVGDLPRQAGKHAQFQTERHVLVNAHVRVQRVVLEHHGDVAVARRHVVDDPVADEDLAAGRLFQARDHAQGGRFAAAGRPDEHEKFTVADVEVQAVDGANFFFGLGVGKDLA